MEENKFEKDRLAKLLTVGLLSGIIAAGVNIVYMYLHESFTDFSIPEVINLGSVSISSIIPGIFAGLLFFILRRSMKYSKASVAFGVILLVTSLISLAGPLASELPDGSITPEGFAGLTAPMHIFAVLVYYFMLVRSVPK